MTTQWDSTPGRFVEAEAPALARLDGVLVADGDIALGDVIHQGLPLGVQFTDASTQSLRAFLIDHVETGANVITDGWLPYRKATTGLYTHSPLS